MNKKILIAVAVVLAAGAAWYFFGRGEAKYIGHSPEECSRIRFFCAEGLEYFTDDTGCGCRPYVSEQQ